MALVGESGSGKSLTPLAIMRLLPRTTTVWGTIRFGGADLTGRTDAAMRKIRGREIATDSGALDVA
jgi:peptide/nickel transport system ATP-binding protein